MRDENDIKPLVVKDANIIFDFWDLELMDSFLKLDFDIYVTGLVQLEITDPAQINLFRTYVDANLISIDNGDIEEILKIHSVNPGCSIADSSVIEFGLRTGAIILTSDRPLIKATINYGLKGHGLIWCLEELVNKKIINWKVAIKKVEFWMSINDRTPKDICEKFIKDLKEKYDN